MAWVYFVQVGEDGEDGPIKIGTAIDVEKRLVGLQCASPWPLRLLAVMEGGSGLETRLHRDLRSHRIRGEWFHPSPRVLAQVAHAKERTGYVTEPDLERLLKVNRKTAHDVAERLGAGEVDGELRLAIDKLSAWIERGGDGPPAD